MFVAFSGVSQPLKNVAKDWCFYLYCFSHFAHSYALKLMLLNGLSHFYMQWTCMIAVIAQNAETSIQVGTATVPVDLRSHTETMQYHPIHAGPQMKSDPAVMAEENLFLSLLGPNLIWVLWDTRRRKEIQKKTKKKETEHCSSSLRLCCSCKRWGRWPDW